MAKFENALGELYPQKVLRPFSFLYRDELVLAVSYYPEENTYPHSFFLSIDLQEQNADRATLDFLVDALEHLLKNFFENPSSWEHRDLWTPEEYHERCFYWKFSKENIELSLQADALLTSPQEDSELN